MAIEMTAATEISTESIYDRLVMQVERLLNQVEQVGLIADYLGSPTPASPMDEGEITSGFNGRFGNMVDRFSELDTELEKSIGRIKDLLGMK
jgi:hypothetical protein